MRARRQRSITIDAENEEEFCSAFDETVKKYNKKNVPIINEEEMEDTDNLKSLPSSEEDYNTTESNDNMFKLYRSPRSNFRMSTGKFNKHSNDNDDLYEEDDQLGSNVNTYEMAQNRYDDYSDDELGVKDDEEVEENLLIKNEVPKIYESKKDALDLLCAYLKNNITSLVDFKGNSIDSSILYKGKNNITSMSCNSLQDINMNELLDNIMHENSDNNEIIDDRNEINDNCKDDNNNNVDNTNNIINTGDDSSKENFNKVRPNSNSLKEFLISNKPSDITLKILVVSNNVQTKASLISSFISTNVQKGSNSINAFFKQPLLNQLDSPFEIRKKQVKFLDKNMTIHFFDTSESFLKNATSEIYYKISSGFFIFIDAGIKGAIEYLNHHMKLFEKFREDKIFVLFAVNLLFKKDCTISGEDLKAYAKANDMMYIPIKIKDFNIKNNIISNLFNLIILKRTEKGLIKHKRKMIKENTISYLKNKLDEHIKEDHNSESKKFKYDMKKMKVHNSLGYNQEYRINHLNAFDFEDDNYAYFNRRRLSLDL